MEQSHFYLGALRTNTARISLERMGEQEVGAKRWKQEKREEAAVATTTKDSSDMAEV